MENCDQVEVLQSKPDHYYRTEIPNIVFELGLSPDAFCLYVHLKRIAGDSGSCFKSLKSLAKDCRLGETRIRECFKELLRTKLDASTTLISVSRRKKTDGSNQTNSITITDIWRLNGDVYRERFKKVSDGSTDGGGIPRAARGDTSRGEPKEEHIKKNPHIEEKQQQAAPAAAVVSSEKKLYSCLVPLKIPEKEKRWLTDKYSEAIVVKAVAYVTHESFKISTTLTQALKWACSQADLQPLQTKEALAQENKSYAHSLEAAMMPNPDIRFEALNHCTEIVYKNHPYTKSYISSGFKEWLDEVLKKCGYKKKNNDIKM